jgi:glucose/mannose-6-phosphate isomerase
MMNLDDYAAFSQLDPQDMLAHIEGLPDQLQNAWELGCSLPLPEWGHISQVLIAGMGGSAIGADMLAAYAAQLSPSPIFVHRNYNLPAWAKGYDTLVITSSHSGNTEETLSAYKQAKANGCRILAMSTGGKLAQAADRDQLPLWQFVHKGQPRAAVGFSFGLLLAAFTRLGLLPDPGDELHTAIQDMRAQQKSIGVAVPTTQNLAKRMAGQIFGRWVTVIGADVLEPIARRWKGQISEIAKAWSQFEFLPEADHNTLAGVINPEQALAKTFVIFLRAASYHPRNQLRSNLTKKVFMLEGLNTDFIDAQGEGPLSHLWTALHLGDYIAYYLAMSYEVDPTPVAAIEGFKQEMKNE